MPEGHTVHRIVRQFEADFVGRRVGASSPQGRFADGAALLDGLVMVGSRAHGKHLFLGFAADGAADVEPVLGVAAERWLRVHLGLYGAWDFHGQVSPLLPGGDATASLGAPRVRRGVRMGEGERSIDADDAERAIDEPDAFPPDPVGQVRVRLLTDATAADLRGPTACVVVTPDEVRAVVDAAGPDPRSTPGAEGEERFVERLTRRRVAVGQLLMDQAVVSGIGNIYRAEMLFRARLDPYTPGSSVPAEVARELWRDWEVLLDDGIRTGVMITREDLDDEGRRAALADRSQRHAVYGRAGEPCLRCGTPVALAEMAGRKLYWCPGCQV
ncbi:Fpg/Nei family DNA glycosylase [Cellulomonas carbonis]|uniref:DNA-(apurinic or apyrimidinic site) lyase n=1 Tax=Cellulomonas carbonis T26 TaxID=947969 RepID=A0A0A0BRY9_9CELL|nr:zinc finger domain-containing protein [Cellulomonas carbonis]KGM10690.1 DNA glycosylase [Cellulomonas carbonis T26]GGC07620.1 formamidopyrimidine-DNA glycosylase [Cellulomonas carbonis]